MARWSRSSSWTGLRYRKALNMQREPRVALSIHGADQPYRMLEIVGTASLEPRTSWDELDAISNTYLGTDYPYKGDDPAGWHVTVEIERVTPPNDGPQPPSVDPPASGSDLLSPPHFAHVATVSSTGQPRSSVVWHRRPGRRRRERDRVLDQRRDAEDPAPAQQSGDRGQHSRRGRPVPLHGATRAGADHVD